jgi:hypothetical protein
MVNLAHLDAERGAIIDNNRPGSWVWMTRAEFLARWRGNSGGWAIVFLAAPPPPHPEAAQEAGIKGPCVCGDNCTCKAGDCPGKCPTVFGQQNCPGGKCYPTINPFAPAGPGADRQSAVRPVRVGPI